MNSSDLKQLIKRTDNALNAYAKDFKSFVKPIESVFSFNTHNTNEFTNVYVAKKEIEKYLIDNQNCKLAVRELPIVFTRTGAEITEAQSEALGVKEHTKKFKTNGYFSVDSYFNVDINVSSKDPSINNSNIQHLFVEYKSSNIFKYVLLADDFIKYKIYTRRNEANTCFAFINFSKQDMYPTILKSGSPDYILLPKIIDETLFKNDDHVFIYIPTKITTNPFLDKKDSDIKRIYKLITDIEETILGIDENDIEARKHIKLNNDFYVNNIGAFKNGVSTAEILLESYVDFIDKIYDSVKDKIPIKEFNVNTLKLMKEDFFRYEIDFYGQKRNRSLKDGLNTGYKSSLNLLVLFNYLNCKYNLGHNIVLKSFVSEDANGHTNIDYNEILKENTQILLDDEEHKYLEQLSLYAIQFIHNLYERILDFRDDGSYEYKSEYLLIKKTNRLQKLVNELSTMLNIDKVYNIFGNSIKEDGVNYFNFVYKYYNK